MYIQTATGGGIYPWNPNVNSSVYALLLANNSVYAGGTFTTVNNGAYTRLRAAKFDMTNGNADASWVADAGSTVRALEHYQYLSYNLIYMGGDFTSINGTARNYAGAVDAVSGALNSQWIPDPNGTVYSPRFYGQGAGTLPVLVI